MSAVDIFGLLVPVTYLVMLGSEAVFPARAFPPIRFWRLKGFCFPIQPFGVRLQAIRGTG